jgi:hypothetical protein
MSGARSDLISKSPEQSFRDALFHANVLANQEGVRLPYIFGAYKNALELYQQISVDGQSEVLLAYYLECRGKFLGHSSLLITDLIKSPSATDVVKEQLIVHAETVLYLRAKYLTASDASETRNQALFQEQILHLKKDLEIVKVAGHWGYNCVNIPKDGNCLFNAIADQLKQNDLVMANPLHDEPHHALRSLAVKHLRANQECYAVHIPNDTTLSSYTAGLACSGTWGDHLEIMALVRELMITLVLIQDDQNIIVFKSQQPKAIFYLGYETNYHFVSLHKQDNSPLHHELATKIENAPVVEIGPYILHTVLEVKKKVSTVSNSEPKKTVPTTAAKKQVSPILAWLFKSSSSVSTAEDKSQQKKPDKLLTILNKGSSSSLGPG